MVFKQHNWAFLATNHISKNVIKALFVQLYVPMLFRTMIESTPMTRTLKHNAIDTFSMNYVAADS